MAKREPKPPVDNEDDDRRTGWSHSGKGMPSPFAGPGPELGPDDREPKALAPRTADPLSPEEGSVAEDEHRGLAKRLLELRRRVEDNRIAQVKAIEDIRYAVAQLEQTVNTALRQFDTLNKEWERRSRDLETTQREAGEQVRAAGEQVRRVKDELKAIEELRETAADPHDVVKPLRKDIGQLQHDLILLTGQVDRRFEQLPKAKAQPWELRGDDEDPFMVLGRRLQELKTRVDAIERDET